MNTKSSGSIVILGAGHCGGRAAEWLRRLSFDGRLVLVGAEAFPPYERPPLSKTFLTGAKCFADCCLQDDAFYAEQDIELVTGEPATAIDPTAKQVTIGGGTKLTYDKLLIATGAIPRRLSVLGSNLDGVFILRDRVDSEAIRAALQPGARLAVVGGGFIGLEVAASARRLGAEVVVLEAVNQLLGRSVPPEVARDVSAVHCEHGVEIQLNAQITGFLGESEVCGVTMADSHCVDATAVVVGIGIRPETSLAEASGIPSNDGILAGANCATEMHDIFVAGDTARALNARYARRIRLESWQNAEQQAEIAARAMLGQHTEWHSVPWVWSDQYEWNLQVAGFPAEGERTIMRGNVSDGKVVFFALQDDRLIGAAALGQGMSAAKDLRIAQMLIEKKRDHRRGAGRSGHQSEEPPPPTMTASRSRSGTSPSVIYVQSTDGLVLCSRQYAQELRRGDSGDPERTTEKQSEAAGRRLELSERRSFDPRARSDSLQKTGHL